ncbi:MAG: hypothetical protein COA44_10530 [Arcobacter sp.]|nr:MAG: hypothetical protein COA44_10530 [Arcobacter sp.]
MEKEYSNANVSEDYEAKMLEAFVNKPEDPEKGLWYSIAFTKFDLSGTKDVKWHWSWWAFMGSFFYLLYRKAYVEAAVLFFISLLSGVIPFGGLIVLVLAGGYSPFFVYKLYKSKKSEIEEVFVDEDKRISMMQSLGGYNQWVIWLAGVLNVVVLIAIYMIVSSMMDQIMATGSTY